MKKTKIMAAIAAMTIGISSTVSAVDVYLDGTKVNFTTPPYIKSERTLVPLRPVFEQMGWQVEWEDNTKTAMFTKISDEYNKLVIQVSFSSPISNAIILEDYRQFTYDKYYIVTDIKPEIKNGASMLPLRALGEIIDKKVTWDGNSQSVYLKDGTPDNTYMKIHYGSSVGLSGLRENAGVSEKDELISLTPEGNTYMKSVRAVFQTAHGVKKTATLWENGEFSNIGDVN